MDRSVKSRAERSGPRPPPCTVSAMRAAWAFTVVVCLAASLGGCARGWRDHIAGPIPAPLVLPLDGVYDATIHTEFVGSITFRLAAKPTEQGFIANTRPGVAWEFVGGLEGLLGRLFVPYLFPGGVLVTWTSEEPRDGKPGAGMLRAGAVPGAMVRTSAASIADPIEILAADGRRLGLMTLRSTPDPGAVMADYPALATSLEAALRERWLQRSSVDEASLASFHRRVAELAKTSRDDLEFLFGIAMAARAHLRSIPGVPIRTLDPGFSERVRLERRFVSFGRDPAGGPAMLKIDAMLDLDELESAISDIVRSPPTALIVDLRSCAGIDPRALRIVEWFIEKETVVGVAMGASPVGTAGAAGPPIDVPVDDLGESLDPKRESRLVARPREDRYTGPLAVLVSRRTIGVPEVVAWALQRSGRAVVVGQATMGRAFLYERAALTDGWEAQIPTMKIVPEGQEDPVRIVPDVETSREGAMRAATRELGRRRGTAPVEP